MEAKLDPIYISEKFRVSTKESLRSLDSSLTQEEAFTPKGMKKKGMQKSRLNDPYLETWKP